jgi:hypothetical protein
MTPAEIGHGEGSVGAERAAVIERVANWVEFVGPPLTVSTPI